MATLTINSEAVLPVYTPLELNFTGANGFTNSKQFINISDDIDNGTSNVQSFSYPTTIAQQTLFYNPQNFDNTPDEFTINSVTLSLGTGATGDLHFTEEDNSTVPTLPVTIPINTVSPTTQYIVGVSAFNTGSTSTRITINATLTDSISGDSYTTDITIDFEI